MIINDAKIFLLDDKQEIINMIEPALRKEGYENIFSANNVTTAEKAVKEITPDIMILVMLPDGDGIDFMKEVRKSSEYISVFIASCMCLIYKLLFMFAFNK